MRILLLGAVLALAAAPAFAEEMNGDTGQIIQPGISTPVASGASNGGSAGTLPASGQDTSTAKTNAGGQGGIRTGGAAPDTNKTQ